MSLEKWAWRYCWLHPSPHRARPAAQPLRSRQPGFKRARSRRSVSSAGLLPGLPAFIPLITPPPPRHRFQRHTRSEAVLTKQPRGLWAQLWHWLNRKSNKEFFSKNQIANIKKPTPTLAKWQIAQIKSALFWLPLVNRMVILQRLIIKLSFIPLFNTLMSFPSFPFPSGWTKSQRRQVLSRPPQESNLTFHVKCDETTWETSCNVF